MLTIDCGEGRHDACSGSANAPHLIPQLRGEEFDCACPCHRDSARGTGGEMRPRRFQRKRIKGWRMPKGAVNVCRPCDWGNPFPVGGAVQAQTGASVTFVKITPELAVVLFEAWVRDYGFEEQIRLELEGKHLVCWCKPDAPCHADVLLRIANDEGLGPL